MQPSPSFRATASLDHAVVLERTRALIAESRLLLERAAGSTGTELDPAHLRHRPWWRTAWVRDGEDLPPPAAR